MNGGAKDLIYLVPPIIFFVTYFFYTQKIYSHNRFFYGFAIAILITFFMFLFGEKTDYEAAVPANFLLLLYVLLLFFLKKTYKRLNAFCIKKQWVQAAYSNKDFTWVIISHSYNPIWDEKRSSQPSWLDYVLSYALLILPLLFGLGLQALVHFLFYIV